MVAGGCVQGCKIAVSVSNNFFFVMLFFNPTQLIGISLPDLATTKMYFFLCVRIQCDNNGNNLWNLTFMSEWKGLHAFLCYFLWNKNINK